MGTAIPFDMERRIELYSMPSINEQMPVKFKDGTEWDNFDGYCGRCNLELPAEKVRGTVARPFEEVTVIQAVGICEACKVSTCYNYRIYPGLRITGQQKDGSWREWRYKKTTVELLWGKAKRLLGLFRT